MRFMTEQQKWYAIFICSVFLKKSDKVIRKFLTTARWMGHHEFETGNWHKT